MTIAIIDYGMGNLRSVAKAFEYLGYRALVTADPQLVREADRVVLPGVGAFGRAMANLNQSGMAEVVREVIGSGRPFLGICLGLQLLFESSSEVFGGQKTTTPGLGIFPGRVLRFAGKGLKVPQIGWNQLHQTKPGPIWQGVAADSFVYFVHSYYVKPDQAELVAATTDYGITYCSGITRHNLTALQFHPEKSSRVGLQILKNFGGLKI